jgi:hypothetical protein
MNKADKCISDAEARVGNKDKDFFKTIHQAFAAVAYLSG